MGKIIYKLIENNTVEIEIHDNTKFNRLLPLIQRMIELEYSLVLTIDSDFAKFQTKLGEYCANNIELPFDAKSIVMDNDEFAYQLIGNMVLTFYIQETFFVKSIAEKMVYEIKKVD
jgi:hypothetical protein